MRGREPTSRYQKQSGKTKIIFLLILLIVGAIIVLIYKKPSRHDDAPPVLGRRGLTAEERL